MGCDALKTVTLPEGITSIPVYMFLGCTNLTEIQIPNSVTEIGSDAFSRCYSLREVTIPAAVESIGDSVFSGCQSLETIYVDPANRMYTSVDGILYDAELTRIISVPAGISGHVVIPEGVKLIGQSAFAGCSKLEGITLPDSVEVIGMAAFSGCSELAEIHLGPNIVNILHSAFDYTAYYYNPGNWEDGVLYIGEYAVSVDPECRHVVIRDGTRLISHTVNANVETYWMPDSVRYISESSFNGADSLKSIRFSRNLEVVRGSFFSSLRSINLPDNVKKVSGGAFIGPNLQYIKGGAVENSYNDDYFISLYAQELKTLYIPYNSEAQLYFANEDCAPEEIIISTTGNMDTIFLQNVPYTTKLYTYMETDEVWPAGWSHDCDTYYRDEWNLATFYINESIVTMDPMALGEVVQVPAEMLVNEFLPEGSVFYGWDINGDGIADKLPVTLTEDLEAHAVFDVPISEIAFAETETTMEVTDEKVLEVLYTPSRFDSNGEVMWTSSDETVAIVDQNGKITALAEGQATITATLKENSNISASCQVNVIPLQPGIRLQETYSELNVGQTVLLEPRYVLLEDVMDTLTFTSWDESVATVDQNGLITAIGPGAATIVISCGDYMAMYTVSVWLPLEAIAIIGVPETVIVGDVVELDIQFFPENATGDRWVEWFSSDEDILSVNEGGYIFTARSAGTVTITAESPQGFTAECEITVLAAPPHTHIWQDGLCSICGMTLAEAADLSGDGKITVFDAQMLAEAKSGVRTLSDDQWMLLGNMEPADIVAYILNGGAQKIILKELPKLTPTDNPLDDWHLAAFLKVEEKQPEDAQKRTEEEKPWNGSDNVCFDAQSKTAELLWELGKNGVLESSADTLIEMLGLQLTDSTGTVQNAAFTVLEVKYYTAVEGGYEEHVIKLKEADFCAERSEGVFAAEIAKIEDALKISDVVAIYVKAALDTEKMDAAMPEMAALLTETSVTTKQENGC